MESESESESLAWNPSQNPSQSESESESESESLVWNPSQYPSSAGSSVCQPVRGPYPGASDTGRAVSGCLGRRGVACPAGAAARACRPAWHATLKETSRRVAAHGVGG